MALFMLGISFSTKVQSFILGNNLLVPKRIRQRSSALSILHSVRFANSSSSGSNTPTKRSNIQPPQPLSQLISEAPVIVLKRSRQSKAFRNGNQLVFTRAIQSGEAPTSALVQVAVLEDGGGGKTTSSQSQQQQSIGWGVYNPDSLYKVRILCHRYLQPCLYKAMTPSPKSTTTTTVTVQDAWHLLLNHHLTRAVQKRRALQLPSATTGMYRLVNGEGDGLSGLQVDVIDAHHIVVQSSAAWCQDHQDSITSVLRQVTQCPTIIWKVAAARLKQDGYQASITSNNDDDDDDDNDGNSSDDNAQDQAVLAVENGVTFQTFPFLQGQKTGVYCDQRENRHILSQYTHGKTVLDLCCYHGGFSLTAICKGNAKSAIGVDSSAAAIQVAHENARLNKCDDKVTFVQSDITTYMQQAAADGTVFDVVVLDPPKLAPTAASLDKARRKYHGLNRDAIKLVNVHEGGLLLTCTCSAAMTQQDGGQYFLEMVSGAALAAGREVTLLSKAGAASCHSQSPISWPAGAYLTAALFFVHPIE